MRIYIAIILFAFAAAGVWYVLEKRNPTLSDTAGGLDMQEPDIASTTPVTTGTSSSQTYTNATYGFSFAHPVLFEVKEGTVSQSPMWRFGATSEGQTVAAVVIERTFEPSTNFADAVFTIGVSTSSQSVAQCLDAGVDVLPLKSSEQLVMIGGVQFNQYEYEDAGAGNFRTIRSYRTVRRGMCIAIEQTIHSTNLGAYSPDQNITAFDEQKVQDVLDHMMQSFTFIR